MKMEVDGWAGSAESRPMDVKPSGMAQALASPEAELAADLLAEEWALSGQSGPEGGPLTIATTAGTLTLSSLDRAVLSARVASDNKGRDIVVLDMRSLTPLYDYFVIATGTSRWLAHTITEEVDAALREVGDQRLSVEGYESSSWIVQDYGDLMVHVFSPQAREYYGIEELWGDAPRVDWERHEAGGD
jgi:ribosome-associated protein